MDEKDIIITPLYIILIYLGAFWYRAKIKDPVLKKYFIWGLSAKIIGAISLGVIYQFYYGFGDTFNYFNQGSVIYNAMYESPINGIELLRGDHDFSQSIAKYVNQIKWYYAKEYFIIKVSAIFSIISFNNYTTNAILFATISYHSVILLYKTFSEEFNDIKKEIALISFFIPSVFFWGSGLTKDTLTMIGLNYMLYSSYHIFIKYKMNFINFILLIAGIYILKNTKMYIFLAFIPSFSLWSFIKLNAKINSKTLKIMLFPAFIIIGSTSSYFGINSLMEGSKYSIDNVSKTVNIASKYHNSISTEKEDVKKGYGGSGYGLEEFDGSINGLIKLGPKALIISLYRPFLWEVRNPVMILSALESFSLLYLTFLVFKKKKLKILSYIKKPSIIFCFSFSIIVAVSTGLTSGNFGNLSRYRIPALPFFCIALIVLLKEKEKKNSYYLTKPSSYHQ